jgi:hypothetical protein
MKIKLSSAIIAIAAFCIAQLGFADNEWPDRKTFQTDIVVNNLALDKIYVITSNTNEKVEAKNYYHLTNSSHADTRLILLDRYQNVFYNNLVCRYAIVTVQESPYHIYFYNAKVDESLC